MLIWQACEIFYFFAVWMHLANFFVTAGDPDWVYALAIVVRVMGQLYLMAMVVRDILRPWHDPVRQDGLSDDPLGGVLDEGVDAESGVDDEGDSASGVDERRAAVDAESQDLEGDPLYAS